MVEKARMVLGWVIYIVMSIIAIFELFQVLFIFSEWYDTIYDFKVLFGITSFFVFFILEFFVILPISKKHNYQSSDLRNFFSIKHYIKNSEKVMFVIICAISILSIIVINKRENGIHNELFYFGLISGPLSYYQLLSFSWLRRKMGKIRKH